VEIGVDFLECEGEWMLCWRVETQCYRGIVKRWRGEIGNRTWVAQVCRSGCADSCCRRRKDRNVDTRESRGNEGKWVSRWGYK
jgi:hypothetical protein